MRKVVLICIVAVLLFSALLFGFYYYLQTNYKQTSFDLQKTTDTNPTTNVVTNTRTDTSTSTDTRTSTNTNSNTVPNINIGIIPKFDIKGSTLKTGSPETYIVAFLGDQGSGDQPTRVLRTIKSEQADVVVVLGDFDYVDNPTYWYGLMTTELGSNFPIIPVIGNHDEKEWKGYSALLASHMKKTPQVSCNGVLGVKMICSFADLKIFVTAPGITTMKGQVAGSSYAEYITSTAKKENINIEKTWGICAWHKNQKLMQLGAKADETGWEVYETCRELGFPIMTGHEHSYSRSFIMNNIKNQTLVSKVDVEIKSTTEPFVQINTQSTTESAAQPILQPTTQSTLGSESSVFVSKKVDQLNLKKGQTFVTVSGLGGREARPQILSGDWWSSIYTATQGAKSGALFCAFHYQGEKDKALCYFKNIDGEVIDTFLVVR